MVAQATGQLRNTPVKNVRSQIGRHVWGHDEDADVWAGRHCKGGRRLANGFRKRTTKGTTQMKHKKVCVSVPLMRCDIKKMKKPKALQQGHKGNNQNPFPVV